MKKIILFLFLILGWILTWVVYASINKYENVSLVYQSARSINIDSNELNNFIVWYKSDVDISVLPFYSTCNTKSEYLSKNNDIYFFKIQFLDNLCKNSTFFLKNWEQNLAQTKITTSIVKDFDIYNMLLDFDTYTLSWMHKKLTETIANTPKNNIDFNLIDTKQISLDRKNTQIKYLDNILNTILTWRQNKYLIPVAWHTLPTRKDKLPNWPRPYRASYTDWVHEWWDIDAPEWTPVRALDDWLIIRVTNNFEFEDLNAIIYPVWNNTISDEQKMLNLDILRWNQIWIKTMKWDVMFYSHLSQVYDNVQVWTFVKAWTEIGTVWKTWVPDKEYKDFHLHFEVRQNPYTSTKVWKNTVLDYMWWNWYFKWYDREYLLQNQYNIFK